VEPEPRGILVNLKRLESFTVHKPLFLDSAAYCTEMLSEVIIGIEFPPS